MKNLPTIVSISLVLILVGCNGNIDKEDLLWSELKCKEITKENYEDYLYRTIADTSYLSISVRFHKKRKYQLLLFKEVNNELQPVDHKLFRRESTFLFEVDQDSAYWIGFCGRKKLARWQWISLKKDTLEQDTTSVPIIGEEEVTYRKPSDNSDQATATIKDEVDLLEGIGN